MASAQLCFGQIKTDSSLGKPARTFVGPNFEISSKHGRQSGGNLFHSFSAFNINSGETATFTGPNSVRNFLARVTGGKVSNIDGTLRCAIPNANFFLMNPSGVVFGPNARLDVKGSFAVTTADYLASANGKRFDATTLKDPVLFTEAPAAFGFLGPQTGSIKIRGASLAVSEGKILSLVSGNGSGGLEIIGLGRGARAGETTGASKHLGGVLRAPAGRVNLLSVDSAGELQLDAADATRSPKVRGFAKLGDIALSDHAFVSVDGPAGGLVSVRAENLTLATSSMSAQTLGEGNGKGFDINVRDSFVLTGKGSLISDTRGTGHGGDINITAGNRVSLQAHGTVDPDFYGLLSNTTGVIDNGQTPGGTGGDIHVSTKSLLLTDAGSIRSETRGQGGNGGSIFIDAGSVIINGTKNDFLTGISVRSQPSKEANTASAKTLTLANPGRSGDIHLNADSLSLYGGGRILAETGEPGKTGRGGAGTGGNIHIVANEVLIAGHKKHDATASGIRATALRKTTGNAGDITIESGFISLRGGGLISADTLGLGSGGVISMNAQTIDVDGVANFVDPTNVITPLISQISAKTTGAGRGGGIVIDTASLHLSNQAMITTATGDLSSGEGGRIEVNADQIAIHSGASLQVKTGIDSTGDGGGIRLGSLSRTLTDLTLDNGNISALTGGAGNAGDIVVQSDNLSINNGGAILADTTSSGAGGFIAIDAINMQLSGFSYTPGIGKFSSQISASTQAEMGGRGGNVFVDTQSLRLTKRAQIAASSGDKSGGQSGQIEINADGITLKSGASIRAATGIDSTGQGGAVLIGTPSRHVQDLVLDRGSIVASTGGSGDGGRITVYARALTELTGGTISAESAGRGGIAGKVTLKIDQQMQLTNSAIQTTSLRGDGGDITIQMTDPHASIDSHASNITTEAGANGGNITFLNVYRVSVVNGSVTTRSGGGGGNINIDPQFVILSNANINASAIEEDGGNITVDANRFLKSLSSTIDASSQKALPGRIEITPPDVNLAGNLVDLEASFDDVAARLQEDCTKRIPPFSNFIVDGRGSVPLDPGMPMPSMQSCGPSTQPSP